MVGESDLDARLETVAHRVEFVELLSEEGPLAPRDVVEALEYSRGTVTRALRELREAGLIERRGEGYAPTIAGALATDEYRRYETAARAILSSGDLLAPIPEDHAPPVELLIDADTILAEAAVPVRALEVVSDRVARAETVRAYLPTLVNTHLLRAWHRAVVGAGTDGDAIFAPDLLTELKGQYPHLLAEMGSTDGFAAFAATGPPYGVILTTTGDTTSVAVVVYQNETAVRGVLVNDTPAAVEWARTELDRLTREASEATDELAALSAAVADGVAPPPRSDAGVGPEHAAGSAPASVGDPSPVAGVESAGHSLPIDLEAEGFVRLSPAYFDAHNLASPAVSWRTGFTLSEIHAGHAVDRRDEDGRTLTQRIVDGLLTGTDHVVLGPPGSGKSTVCMAVACEWYNQGMGPVLYRERGSGDSFESVALLEAYLRQADGRALVVVEDAIREEANAIVAVMQTLDADPSVTFLLDARTHEWHTPDAFDIDARRDAFRRTSVEEITVPDLDERECERFVAHFSALVEADLDLTGADLFDLVEAGTAQNEQGGLPAGDALVAQQYLAQRYDPPVDVDASAPTALDEAVRHTYRSIAAAAAELAPDLAVLVVLLTAAGIPVTREYCYALAPDEDFDAVAAALSLLEGQLLFEPEDPGLGTPTTYRTRHEAWAMRFLEQFRDLESAERARERFGRCVTRLLALADEPDRREHIQRHLGGRAPSLHQIEADPGHWADELVERVFGIGRTNATLAPLFGETTDSSIEIPAACSPWMPVKLAYWRGEMNRIHGDLARAEREFQTLGELAETVALPDTGGVGPDDFGVAGISTASTTETETETPPDPGTPGGVDHRTRWRAASLTNLGLVARDRGEFDTAEAYYKEALTLCRDSDDRAGEAVSLKNLGAVAYLQSDYDNAREYFERSLAIARDLDAGAVEARCLNNLGTLAQDRNEYDRAREYHEASLAIKRELGDRQGEANSLSNLGLLAHRQGDYDAARDYHERSLEIKRELGDRQGEATSLNNLGLVARAQGADDRAHDYVERSLAIRRSIGDRRGEAHSLNELGELARRRDEYEAAADYLTGAIEGFEAVGSESGIARCHLNRGRLALTQNDPDRARERAQTARATFEELGMPHWVGRASHLLGQVEAAAGGTAAASEDFEAALDAFESVGATQDALAALADLVTTCREHGDDERARHWCDRARDVVTTAPEATAVRNREWIERQATELEQP